MCTEYSAEREDKSGSFQGIMSISVLKKKLSMKEVWNIANGDTTFHTLAIDL